MEEKVWCSPYFYGNKISNYGLREGYVDYYTLSSAFDCVLANNIISETSRVGIVDWEIVSGDIFDEDGEYQHEIFQYYIISQQGYDILSHWTDEIIFYNEDLDLYVWGVTHFGTSWDYVLTDIKVEIEPEE